MHSWRSRVAENPIAFTRYQWGQFCTSTQWARQSAAADRFRIQIKRSTCVLLAAGVLAGAAFAQSDERSNLSGGSLHFSARDIDADHDGMISKDEFMKYHADAWDKMTRSSGGSMATSAAGASFARGGMHVNVTAMDADHDGVISRDEFMQYEASHWDLLPKDARGLISVADFETLMQAHRRKAAAEAAAAGESPKPD